MLKITPALSRAFAYRHYMGSFPRGTHTTTRLRAMDFDDAPEQVQAAVASSPLGRAAERLLAMGLQIADSSKQRIHRSAIVFVGYTDDGQVVDALASDCGDVHISVHNFEKTSASAYCTLKTDIPQEISGIKLADDADAAKEAAIIRFMKAALAHDSYGRYQTLSLISSSIESSNQEAYRALTQLKSKGMVRSLSMQPDDDFSDIRFGLIGD